MHKLFADLRQHVVAAMRTWGAETAAPDAFLSALTEQLLPSIRLVPCREGTRCEGGLRLGGEPDLPVGVAWPRVDPADAQSPPMSLILQVNLEETNSLDANHVLPAQGILSLFYYWDDDAGGDAGRVLYFPAPVRKLHRARVPDDLPEENRYRAFGLEPRPEWTLPRRWAALTPQDDYEPELEQWFTLRNRVEEAQELQTVRTGHRLLGHADLIQSDQLPDGQVLLLQAGPDYSADDMEWGDGGMLYASLDPADLKTGKLDRAAVLLEMG